MAGQVMQEPRSERDRAYDALRGLILAGRLPPGAEISQNELTQALNFGRTPIRDAIARLRSDGLVSYEAQNRRWAVRPVSPEELDDLYASRILLEPFIARMTIESLTDESLSGLRNSLEASSQALRDRDMDAFQEHHRSFHMGLAGGSGIWSQQIIENLWDLAERYRRLMLTELPSDGLVSTTICQHEAIMDAAVARDAAAGSRAVALHLNATAQRLFVMFGPRFRPVAVAAALAEAGLPNEAEWF